MAPLPRVNAVLTHASRLADAVPVTYLWLKDCSERSYADDRPTRLEPLKYVASAPIKRDSRSRRYRRLKDVEKDKMAEFYALLQAGKMGRRELSERMERLLYDQVRSRVLVLISRC